MSPQCLLVVVLGPTASGKSALGIQLARELTAEIVVCDSAQIYRHFDIGTAKVPESERQGIAHWMMDLAGPEEVFTAGDYARQAAACVEEIYRRGKLPIVTAGTGLYLRALLEGLADAPARSEELRARLREREKLRGREYLHGILAHVDPQAAQHIAPRDAQKTIRAIEMRLLSGKSVAEIHASGRRGVRNFRPLKLGLQPPRPQLYARINRRVLQMVAAGWVEEVRRLLAQGISASAKPFEFIGYAEILAHVQGGLSLPEAIESIQQATRRFAKRQITWFRREREVHWLTGFGDEPETLAAGLAYLQSQIETAKSPTPRFRTGV